MSVVEAVVDHPTGAAGLDDAGRPKQAQGVGDVRIERSGRCREIADAKLARLEQRIEQTGAGDVAEQSKELGQSLEFVVVE